LDKETYDMPRLFNVTVICKGGRVQHIDTGGPQRGFNVKEKKRGNTICRTVLRVRRRLWAFATSAGGRVFADQAGSKNQRGYYLHAQCASGAGDERVGVSGVSPPIGTKAVKEVVK
jgi:hypothetical protein